MSRILLKRINTKNEQYKSRKTQIIKDYEKTGKIVFSKEEIESYCETIKYNDEDIVIEIDFKLLDGIVFGDDDKYKNKKYQREAELSSYFAKIFKYCPRNIVYDAKVWTYLNMCVLFKYVEALYLEGRFKNPTDRIERYLFNITMPSKIDRTGMRFLWFFGDKLNLDENTERASVAMEYIDPVKAIFERKIACNDLITRAFVDAIIKGGKNTRLKNAEMRIAVPHHIQCYAGVTNLDAFDYDELVDVLVEEQNRILNKQMQ